MKIYIASRSPETLNLWRECIGLRPEVEYTTDVPPALKADAVAITGAYAFDRYGGRPNRQEAQILENTRGDGFPRYVIVPPYCPRVENEDVTPAYHAIGSTLHDVLLWNELAHGTAAEVSSLVLDLALLQMDNPRDASTPSSVARAMTEKTSCSSTGSVVPSADLPPT